MNTQRGITLFELIIVLVIATSIILMGFQRYQMWKIEQNFLVLKYNVNVLFQGLKQYYQANCDDQTTGYDIVKAGALSPSTLTDPLEPQVIAIDDIAKTLSAWPRPTYIVDASVNSGYDAQFNPFTTAERKAYACSYFGSSPPQCEVPPSVINNTNIILWQAQVVVKMRDPSTTMAYLGTVGADCAVNTFNPGDVIDCSKGIASMDEDAQYLVWQRLPSFTVTDMRSSQWLSEPLTKILKLQYTHDPMYEMYNENDTRHRNYLCGG